MFLLLILLPTFGFSQSGKSSGDYPFPVNKIYGTEEYSAPVATQIMLTDLKGDKKNSTSCQVAETTAIRACLFIKSIYGLCIIQAIKEIPIST